MPMNRIITIPSLDHTLRLHNVAGMRHLSSPAWGLRSSSRSEIIWLAMWSSLSKSASIRLILIGGSDAMPPLQQDH
jgi:hypothetical protein